ncbi:MAG: transglutaminase domain-containing protein [SAR324 cluster bacterium]|nr:transglutaminase domain-containing protein [SAR324 cluster bacterium]
MDPYLKPTIFFDFENPIVLEFAEQVAGGIQDKVDIAKALYLAVRDEIQYNPYTFSVIPETLSASHVVRERKSYCIPKAVLLGALARHFGIPSRLGLANVRNHLSSPQLIAWLKSDVFAMHGYIELFLEGKWVKATPAFNQSLCQKMGVAALEFDGRQDSIFQQFTKEGRKHMEYLKLHGEFADLPYDLICRELAKHYPHLINAATIRGKSLESDLQTSS